MILFFENREGNTEMKAMSNAELRLKNVQSSRYQVPSTS
jgi:hypothetical protein